MATSTYLRRAGRAPASGSVFETLALEPPAATKPAPRPGPLISVDASLRSSPRARFGPLDAEVPPSALLFDALGLEAGGAAALRAPRRGQPLSTQQVAARLAKRAEQAARAAAAARAARAAAKEGPEAAAPSSRELLDAVALALEAGCRVPGRQGADKSTARPVDPTGAHWAEEVSPKGATPRPPVSAAATNGFDRRWSMGSTDGGSGSVVDSEGVSPSQTEDQLPPVSFWI